MSKKTAFERDSRVTAALEYLSANPTTPIRALSRQFDVSRSTLQGRLAGRSSLLKRPVTNTTFTNAEEQALCRYIDSLDNLNLSGRREFIVEAANTILREKYGNEAKPVGIHWIDRFIKRHKFNLTTQKKPDAIHSLLPLAVLTPLCERQARHVTPEQQTGELGSSPCNRTPITLRQMNKVADRLHETADKLDKELLNSPAAPLFRKFVKDVRNLVKGMLSVNAELVLVKKDLGHTKLAQEVLHRRRAAKNTPLQTGGVLHITDGRAMVVQKQQNVGLEAQKILDRQSARFRTKVRKWGLEAAKRARKWRIDGRMGLFEYPDGKGGCKRLNRG